MSHDLEVGDLVRFVSNRGGSPLTGVGRVSRCGGSSPRIYLLVNSTGVNVMDNIFYWWDAINLTKLTEVEAAEALLGGGW